MVSILYLRYKETQKPYSISHLKLCQRIEKVNETFCYFFQEFKT